MKLTGLLALLLLMVSDGISSDPASHNNDYLNSFAVQVTGGLVEAEAVASDLGFLVDREVNLPYLVCLVPYESCIKSMRWNL